jgi:Type III restriction enzyme, res subunit/Helicase C-terminal domain
MPQFDFAQLRPQPQAERPVDPIVIFQRARVSDSSINDLWLAQGDALRKWHEHRNENDIAVSLNTGAGKTLVGLLMGQSLVNETRSSVVYVCSSIQLVLQTEKKANGYGLPVTRYVEKNFSNDLFSKGEALCVTTYQALFNGRSIFFNRDLVGIIFDDAHAAEHLIRDHFSLHVGKKQFEKIYATVTAEFADYFNAAGLAATYKEVRQGTAGRLVLIPPTELRRSHAAVRDALSNSEIPKDPDTRFAWAHLKDRIDLCAMIVSPSAITLTPPFVPVRTLRYFSNDVRRIYLSATLSAPDAFIRTFGREPSFHIQPSTTAGECERMILVPSKMAGNGDDIKTATTAIRNHKALILVPTYARAEKWSPIKPPPKEKATSLIEEFKNTKATKKLLLAARYDGMDFPGDMCRVLVIDDLPSGVNPLDRYLWEYLRLSSRLMTAIASRVIQSFGRISRGMSDHGVVLITGKRLVEWLQVPRNAAALPRFLQKQIQLGLQMSGGVEANGVAGMIQSCLQRNPDWLGAYERFILDAPTESQTPQPVNTGELALAEAKYAEHIWHRNFNGAASQLQKTLDIAAKVSLGTVCWHKLWLGFALECAGDADTARRLYRQAHTGERNIPPPRPDSGTAIAENISSQVRGASYQFEVAPNSRIQAPRSLERDLTPLGGGASSAQTEEALHLLGQYLGFEASRPDQEHGTGPDVLWIFGDAWAFCADVKTDKEQSSVYRKSELGQLSDHVQWVKNNFSVDKIVPAFIGPEVSVSDVANPPAGVKVATLEKFRTIGDAIVTAYRDVASSALSTTLLEVLNEEFARRELLWPALERLMQLVELRSLNSK